MWQLVFGMLQQLSATPAIVVERNMFAYYKLPLRLLDMESRHTSKSLAGQYYVLQCPPKLDNNIPMPKDMQTCSVVDQYKDIWQNKDKRKKTIHNQKQVPRVVLSPLPPATVRRMKWGWRQRRSKRQNQYTATTSTMSPDEGTPLQYLGQPHRQQKLLKLAADHSKFKKGSRFKGYQHMYHRDETYNDHIFYDELQLDGKSEKRGKSKILG